MNLTSKEGVVTKSVGETALLQWNIEKGNNEDTITTAVLTLLKGSSRTALYTLNLNEQKPLALGNVTTEVFGDRMTADIKGGEMYLVTLRKLIFNDANVFELAVETGQGTFESGTQRVNIELRVQGMEEYNHLLFFFLKQ